MQPASASRSSRRLESSSRAGIPPPAIAVEAAVRRIWTVIPSRSFASRHASWRSGDSGSASRMRRGTPWYAVCGSAARSISIRTR